MTMSKNANSTKKKNNVVSGWANSWTMAWGNVAMMPIMINSEMPLPTPLSVMRSPSHMMSSVLHVKMVTAENHQNAPAF